MAHTPLGQRLALAGARMGEYCGAETAAAFSDPRAEFAALVRTCGIYDLGWRAHFRISGKDRVRWLNGMVSNNVRELPANHGNYNFVLTPQAHIQGDLYAYNLGDSCVAGTELCQLEKLLALLRRYIIMDKVELTDLSSELTAIGVQGPNAREVLDKAGFEAKLLQPLEIVASTWRGTQVLIPCVSNEQFESYEIWAPPAEIAGMWEALSAAGATPAGTDALEMFRIAAGTPRYGLDIRERDLPQETGQMQALSFTKGCYIGQEIVERIRSRGGVHRTFAGIVLQGSPPAAGTKIQVNGKEIGEITSALRVPLLEEGADAWCVLALGYVRREAAKPDTLVEVAGASGSVSVLPFPKIFASESSHAS